MKTKRLGGKWIQMAAAASLALLSAVSHADTVSFLGRQEVPMPEGMIPSTPPVLGASILDAMNRFNAEVTVLGTHGFEPGPTGAASTSFSYNGGTAAVLSGTPVLIDGNELTDLTLGRYNMTPGLPDGDYGHWLEGSSDFAYRFTSALTAFSFFGTDFTDFDGAFALELRNGDQLVYTTRDDPDMEFGGGNGNLTYLGLVTTEAFDTVVFRINQQLPTDIFGFDSFVVGVANSTGPGTVPEPGTLALVGLSLAGLAAARRARKQG